MSRTKSADEPNGERAHLLSHYRTMRAELTRALDGLTEAQLAERTLDGWSVSDHLLHVAAWDEIRSMEIERISAGQASAWRMTGDQDDAFNELLHEVRKHLGVDQALWESETSFGRLIRAIEQANPRAFAPDLYGEAGLLSGHMREHAEWITRWRNERGY